MNLLDTQYQEILQRHKPQPWKCPLCELEGKQWQTKTIVDCEFKAEVFRLHLFLHYYEQMKPRVSDSRGSYYFFHFTRK